MPFGQFDVRIVGQALEDEGFVAFNTISGLGLNTFGFLWPCADIWAPTDDPTLVTTWTDCPDGNTPTVEDCPE